MKSHHVAIETSHGCYLNYALKDSGSISCWRYKVKTIVCNGKHKMHHQLVFCSGVRWTIACSNPTYALIKEGNDQVKDPPISHSDPDKITDLGEDKHIHSTQYVIPFPLYQQNGKSQPGRLAKGLKTRVYRGWGITFPFPRVYLIGPSSSAPNSISFITVLLMSITVKDKSEEYPSCTTFSLQNRICWMNH